MQAATAGSLVAVSSLREFFRDAFHAASEHQHLDIDEQAEQYVVNLLTLFARSEALYERTSSGTRLKPLVVMLAEALEAPSTQDSAPRQELEAHPERQQEQEPQAPRKRRDAQPVSGITVASDSR